MDEDKRNDVIGMEARMYAPLEWDSSAMCKIQDLKEAQFEEALRLIKVEQRKNLEKTYNTLNSSTAINYKLWSCKHVYFDFSSFHVFLLLSFAKCFPDEI